MTNAETTIKFIILDTLIQNHKGPSLIDVSGYQNLSKEIFNNIMQPTIIWAVEEYTRELKNIPPPEPEANGVAK